MSAMCGTLTIFEGPDGSGKTTLAKEYAAETGAIYVHFAQLPQVNASLARMHVEAMLPALLGYSDVVFDRCWLSEYPYGVAFRGGADRLGEGSIPMLERVAYRCNPVLVKCLPPFESVKATFLSRKTLEMLDNTSQLEKVYDLYQVSRSALPVVHYDYTNDTDVRERIAEARSLSSRHIAKVKSVGCSFGKVLLVGDEFGEPKDCDTFYQLPFVSFSHLGCSRWLATKMQHAGIDESNIFWVNSKLPEELEVIKALRPGKILITMGKEASERVQALGIKPDHKVHHPQSWKRFHAREVYPLINLLKAYQNAGCTFVESL